MNEREHMATSAGCAVRIEFGRKSLQVDAATDLKPLDVIELDTFVDDYVDVYAAGRLIARGLPVVVDGKVSVRVQETLGAANILAAEGARQG